jgi:hypothetical protein
MEVIFDVFSAPVEGEGQPILHKEILVKLLTYIGKHDPSINSQFIHAINQALRYFFLSPSLFLSLSNFFISPHFHFPLLVHILY